MKRDISLFMGMNIYKIWIQIKSGENEGTMHIARKD